MCFKIAFINRRKSSYVMCLAICFVIVAKALTMKSTFINLNYINWITTQNYNKKLPLY